MTNRIQGIITPLVTPFDNQGKVNFSLLMEFIDFQIESGVTGVMLTAGTGEFTTLSEEERRMILQKCVKHIDNRVPVFAGILYPDTNSGLDFSKYAASVGVNGLVAINPFYIKPSIDGLRWHFEKLLRGSGLPIILYNNPGRTGIYLDSSFVEEFSKIEGIIGIKECERDLANVSLKIAAVKNGFSVLSGEDDLLFPTLMIGALGGIVAIANIAPRKVVQLFNSVRSGDTVTALELHYQLLPLIRAFYTVNHPGPLKEALAMSGWAVGQSRKPLWPAPETTKRQLEEGLRLLKMLKTN